MPPAGAIQSLLLRYGLAPFTPAFMFRLSRELALDLGSRLTRLLPGQEVTGELFNRRGQADLDRIDRLTRNITREIDHVHWLKGRGHRVAFVRQGERIAAYAYGGEDAVGPVAGATQKAALSGMGWALGLAARSSRSESLRLLVPARFAPAVEVLLEAGAHLHATLMVYAKGLSVGLDRCVLAGPSLP